MFHEAAMDIQPQLPLSKLRIVADGIALSCWSHKEAFLTRNRI